MLKYCILCVVFIKLIFGCWNNPVYQNGEVTVRNRTNSSKGDQYGGYDSYFENSDVYTEYGDDPNAADALFGPGGLNTKISESSENALLPSDAISQDALKNTFTNKWDTWMKDYFKNKELEKEQSGILTSAERKEQMDPFWPGKLIGYGKGDEGEPVPPYAYVPVNNEGLPSLCFEPVNKGTYRGIKCTSGPRYAFMAGIKICVAFYFRGCGGNQNNFKTKRNCEDTCTKVPEAGCNPNTMQQIDRIITDYSLF